MKPLPAILCTVLSGNAIAQTPFTYETDEVLVSAGDFGTADGLLDVVLVNRVTGNVMIGRQKSDLQVAWTPSTPCGITGVTGLAVGRFNGSTGDAAAFTAPASNRITLATPGSADTQIHFRHIFPTNPSPRGLAPFDANADGNTDLLVVGDRVNPLPRYYYEMLGNIPSGAAQMWQAAFGGETWRVAAFTRKIGTVPVIAEHFSSTLFLEGVGPAGISSSVSLPGVALNSSTLMTYGNFDGSAYSQVLLYIPGNSFARAAKLTEPSPGTFAWAPATTINFSSPIRQLVTIPTVSGTPRLGVLLMDKTADIYTFDGTTLTLRNHIVNTQIDWLCPTNNDVLIARNNLGWLRYNTSVTNAILAPTQAGAMPDSGTVAKVSNVVFLTGAPFADTYAAPVGLGTVRDWSTAATGSGTTWSISAALLGSNGIGTATSSSYTSPASAGGALPNQFRGNISYRSLEPGAGPVLPDLALDPPGGVFRPGETVTLGFRPTMPGQDVIYRINSGGWTTYIPASPPVINSNSAVSAYTTGSAGKSPTRSSGYTFSAALALAAGSTADLDADGMADAWEKSFNLDNPAADADGDGSSNLAEFQASTDPRDASNAPAPVDLVLHAERQSNAGISWLSLTWDDRLTDAVLETSTNLAPGSWTPVATGISQAGGWFNYLAELPPDDPAPKRFYRLRKP